MLADQHDCTVGRWKTILVHLTETNNSPCHHACQLDCLQQSECGWCSLLCAPTLGLLTGSELHMGETHIQYVYKLFAHEHCRLVENFIVSLFLKFDNYDINDIFRH